MAREVEVRLTVQHDGDVGLKVADDDTAKLRLGDAYIGGSGGTRDYERLDNKPRIEGVELVGDKTFPELNLDTMDNTDINEVFGRIF